MKVDLVVLGVAAVAWFALCSAVWDTITEQDEDEFVQSDHGRVLHTCGALVYTVQRNGRGPAFFPRLCPACGKELRPWDDSQAEVPT